jgi:4-amino-4-deoxy-L-arabinose transferase-like glycosyltransferase
MEPRLRRIDRSQPGDGRVALAVVTVLLLLIRLGLDAHLELMFDEAYYALWSRNLAWCYLDHPPMVALWIRASTSLFGDGAFGVRALGTLAAAAGSACIYALSLRLFRNRSEAAFAGLLYCAMLLVAAGAIIITPDTPLVFFWTIAVYAIVRLYQGEDWRWWMVAGFAMGLALQSKYTALLLGAGIVTAMIAVPDMRRWWRHPAPHLAGIVALAMFVPVLVWNREHHWASFAKQFGRAQWEEFSLRYVGELALSQIALLTPFVFMLAAGGVWIAVRRAPLRSNDAGLLLVSLISPLCIYFLVHSLHARVQGNWLAPAYPVLALVAAHAAFEAGEVPGPVRSAMLFARRWALPVGFAFSAVAYLQASIGILPLDPAKDPTALMAGWSRLADDVDILARREKVDYVLTSNYGLTSLLSFYSPGAKPVAQFDERLRWISFAQPRAELFERPGLYVSEAGRDRVDELRRRFLDVTFVGAVPRRRNGKVIKEYVVYRVAQPAAPVLDAVRP